MVERTGSMTHFLPYEAIEVDYGDGINDFSNGKIIFAGDLSAREKRRANRALVKNNISGYTYDHDRGDQRVRKHRNKMPSKAPPKRH